MASSSGAPENVFILPLRQQVIFPNIRTSITINPENFSQLCQFCERSDETNIGAVAIKLTSPGAQELYTTGTYCRISSHAQSTTKAGDREIKLVTLTIEGKKRFQVLRYTQTQPFHIASIKFLEEREGGAKSEEIKALMQTAQQMTSELLQSGQPQDKSGGQGSSLKNLFGNLKKARWPDGPSPLADMIAAGLQQLSIAERQQVLETVDVQKRLELVLELLRKVLEVQKLSREISSKMQNRSEDELRETVLKRHLHDLRNEMRKLRGRPGTSGSGELAEEEQDQAEEEEEDEEDEVASLREALRRAQLSPDAMRLAQRELRRLQGIQPHHPEYTVCRTYLETLASLPWAESSKDDLDLLVAQGILERDHYGLERVKRRILEFLAVQKMRGDMKGPILCLHGPPGVGKTSLGRSVAKALGRKFHRIALGGIRDEAELRGHRRTYIGSMPGAIMQALISLKVNNPVILLDEIDKLTRSAMFNPSGAMLELLDPEQNNTFKDHYLNTPFDLSKVLFLCTCNDLQTIDWPLLDRMEVIELSGYTAEEKVHIAVTHLLPKQRRLHALEHEKPQPGQGKKLQKQEQETEAETETEVAAVLSLSEAAVKDLIAKWTMESGVRSLERRIAQVCRWAALRLSGSGEAAMVRAAGGEELSESQRLAQEALADCGPTPEGRIVVEAQHLPHIMGAELFEPDLAERLSLGVAMGLSVTPVGGQLQFVEATRSKGSSRLTITGQLRQVMRESVSTAMSLLRSKIYYAGLAVSGEAQQMVGVGVGSGQAYIVAEPAQLELGTASSSRLGPSSNSSANSVQEAGRFQDILRPLITQADAGKDPFGDDDIHVHFPAGAIPKDGPSAGVATTLALASLLLSKPVRSDTAVTGEISLRGHVLPVGGVRDKVLAAHRAGLRHVLLPAGNQRHIKDDLPASAVGDIELHFIKHIDEAMAWAFAENVKPWTPVGLSQGASAPFGSLSRL